jgi:aspartyl/glutamyl-tRNA(Asn/Gln) amidotransferase C subunit
MAVDANTVRNMAKLARLEIQDSDLEAMAAEMDIILDFMSQIANWDGETEQTGMATYRRPDVSIDSGGSALIEAAADHDANQVVVPPIKGAS